MKPRLKKHAYWKWLCSSQGGLIWGYGDSFREAYLHWSEVNYKTMLETSKNVS